MKLELEDKLRNKYPKILNGSLVGHIDTGNGWYNLLDLLDANIQSIINANPEIPQLRAVRIKEQCGSLRYIYIGGNRQIWDLINQAVEMSVNICEECGKPGKINIKEHWLKCVCPAHEKVIGEEKSACQLLDI